MEAFWKTEVGKIFLYGIHEHNSGLGAIVNRIAFIQKAIERGQISIEGDPEYVKIVTEYLDDIKEAKSKCKDAVDYIYEKIREHESKITKEN